MKENVSHQKQCVQVGNIAETNQKTFLFFPYINCVQCVHQNFFFSSFIFRRTAKKRGREEREEEEEEDVIMTYHVTR